MDASIVCSGKGLEINQKSHDQNCREMPQIVTPVISNGDTSTPFCIVVRVAIIFTDFLPWLKQLVSTVYLYFIFLLQPAL